MKAAVYKSKQSLVVEEIPTPEPGPDEIQIKISHSAICGTDVHVYLYDIAPPNTVLGHEFAGEVSKIGSNVTRFKLGDRVIGMGGTPPPGKESPLRKQEQFNYRLEGITNSRTRGYAEYTVCNEWEPLKLPDNVSNLEGALAEPCAVVTRAVRLSQQKLGDTVAVLGAGPIGLLCLQAAKAAGANKVIVSEPSKARRAIALGIGRRRSRGSDSTRPCRKHHRINRRSWPARGLRMCCRKTQPTKRVRHGAKKRQRNVGGFSLGRRTVTACGLGRKRNSVEHYVW